MPRFRGLNADVEVVSALRRDGAPKRAAYAGVLSPRGAAFAAARRSYKYCGNPTVQIQARLLSAEAEVAHRLGLAH